MTQDWKLLPDGDEKRKLYYCSREWGLLKRAVRERAGGKCERCQNAQMDAAHHLTYERLYNERLTDLLGVCRPCHDFIGGHTDVDPAEPFRVWSMVAQFVNDLISKRLRQHEEQMLLRGDYRVLDPTREQRIVERRNELKDQERVSELKAQVLAAKTPEEERAILAKLTPKRS